MTEMTYHDIVEKVNDFLVEDFEVEESKLQIDASLNETLDLDSLDYIDLIVAIEENFGFKMKPEDFTTMVIIQDFYNYIAQRLEVAIPA